MNSGAILYDEAFKYSDGSVGEKLLIILNNGENDSYIIVKTTSRNTFKSSKFGCQLEDKYPNFFLPKGSCCLHKDTWIELDYYSEFRVYDLLKGHFSKQIKQISSLNPKITCLLLECAIRSSDISIRNRDILKETLRSLR